MQVTFFVREQDLLEFFYATCVDSGNGKNLDLELLLNKIGEIFKPNGEAPEEDESLQVTLSAQVCKTKYEHQARDRGAAVENHTRLMTNQESRSPKTGSLILRN